MTSVADLAAGLRGGARNIKSMWPPWVAIFFMTHFHRAGGGGMAHWIRYWTLHLAHVDYLMPIN